jgi:S-formylglutathione hydrolase FrmB
VTATTRVRPAAAVLALVIALLASAAAVAAGPPRPAAAQDALGAECQLVEAGAAPTLAVGVVDCLRLPSEHMGAPVPVGFYVPPACAGGGCPVLYYTHGTGGSYREGVGTKGSAGSAWVQALTAGPPVDPRGVADPWRFSDTATWVPQTPLDLIIVSPHGRTLPGGHGPAVGVDTGWFDWHPRYATGGDTPRYDTPPPRPSSFLLEELVPFVDAWFPTSGDREQRAILGYSQGGFGSAINGLLHPDAFASIGMRSGGAIPVPLVDELLPAPAPALGLAPPAPVPHTPLPGLVPGLLPAEAFAQMLVGEATLGWGDVAADHAWFRHSNPVDLMPNARAWGADGRQSVHLQHFVNDAVVRRPEDVAALGERYMATVYETLLHPMNLYMEDLYDRLGVETTFHVGPGDHSGTYGVPYFREQLEGQYGALRHRDGGGEPGPRPTVFDYRTIRTSFEVWGWRVEVDRAATEFLSLTEVSCEALSVRGTGVVTVTVPGWCRTGVDGGRTVTVDLGPSQPVDEPVGAGSTRAYGRTAVIDLTPL